MLWLTLSLLAFVLGVATQRRWPGPWSNPTLIATVLVGAALLLSRTPYSQYRADAAPLSAFLTPAVVALAVPLYRQRALLLRQWRALGLGGLAGTGLAALIDTALARALHLSPDAARALMTAPATSPVAVQLAGVTHAPPALAATLAVLSGLLGALILPPVLTALGLRSSLARGLALGSVSHGIGTARAREESDQAGAASSVGMGLGALIVTLLVALLTR